MQLRRLLHFFVNVLETELWICKAHTPIRPSIPSSYPPSIYQFLYLGTWLYPWWLCQFVNRTHIQTKKNTEHFPIDLLLCSSCPYPICYLSYGWFGLTKPRYILPCLTLPVAMGWGARWAYAVAWWEIIWITIAKPNADKRHSSWELRQVRVWIMVLW